MTPSWDGKFGPLFRWAACGSIVALAHGAVLFALTVHDTSALTDPGAAIPFVDFAPEERAMVGPVDDTPRQEQAAAPPDNAGAETATETPMPKPEIEDAPPDPDAQAMRDQPKKDQPTAPGSQASEEVDQQAPLTVPSPAAIRPEPAGPDTGSTDPQRRLMITRWQRALVLRLERAKRYPENSDSVSGTVRLVFSIDPQGLLLAHRIVASSGSQRLDEEAMSLLERAQPFPPPPAGTGAHEMSFVVPIHFAARHGVR
ncbi:MAG: outer rane transport energization protein TonB [Hyphomicrobiales bacterium]|nr:outer rane transport energization protein TonB [Hyphomicrobiales bacterium]